METKRNYYKGQFDKLCIDTQITIKVSDYNGNKTNYMTLTKECIAELENFIKLVKPFVKE